jgi:hypothetical protein
MSGTDAENVVADEALSAEPATSVHDSISVVCTAETLTQFSTCVSDLAAGGVKFWFRGAKAHHDLSPGLYRHPTISDSAGLLSLEWQLLSDYRHQAPPFAPSLPKEDLEVLFMMQHYRVPTRLLDWTENPFIALFFGIEGVRDESEGSEADAVVWVLNPAELNRRAFPNRDDINHVFGAYSSELAGYRPSRHPNEIPMRPPCALFGVHNSPRIVAQRGSFTLYGADIRSLDKQENIDAGASGILRKILIPGASKRTMFSELFNMGVSDSVVYPDLDGLSRELKSRRGFL